MTQISEMGALLMAAVATVQVDASRCAVVRHRKSQCHRCVDACSYSALTVDQSGVTLSIERCTGCGACVAACALGALTLREASLDDVVLQAEAAAVHHEGAAVISCSGVAPSGAAEAQVPCLAVLNEEQLAYLALSSRVDRVELQCAGCERCGLYDAAHTLTCAVEAARNLVTAFGATTNIELQEVHPVPVGSDRRAFVQELGSFAVQAVLGDSKREPSERQRLAEDAVMNDAAALYTQMTADFHAHGTLDPVSLEGRMALLDKADAVVGSHTGVIEGHSAFASLTVDTAACSGCQICARFCPTQALRAETGKLLFRVGDCLGCGLCADACPGGALTLSNQVEVHKLLDVCPEEISIPVRKTYSLPQRKPGSVALKAYEMMGQKPRAFSDFAKARN